MENDTLKLEHYTFMESYHDAARALIKSDNYDKYGRFIFAINEFALYGNEPDIASFDSVERLIWKLIKPIIAKTRTNANNGRKSKGTQKNLGNSNALKRKQSENKAKTKRKQSGNKAKTTPWIGKDKEKDKDNIKETNVSSCSNEHAAAEADEGKEDIDFSKFLQYFNETMKKYNAPKKISRMTPKRKAHVRARLREYSKEEVIKVIDNFARSDFLQRTAKVDCGWIFLPENFPKVLEGKYNDEGSQKANKAHGNVDTEFNEWKCYE